MEIENFFSETQKMFKSCKRAYANIYEKVGCRDVWGEFSSKNQAAEAAKFWMIAFRQFSPKLEMSMSGKLYRVSVTF